VPCLTNPAAGGDVPSAATPSSIDVKQPLPTSSGRDPMPSLEPSASPSPGRCGLVPPPRFARAAASTQVVNPPGRFGQVYSCRPAPIQPDPGRFGQVYTRRLLDPPAGHQYYGPLSVR